MQVCFEGPAWLTLNLSTLALKYGDKSVSELCDKNSNTPDPSAAAPVAEAWSETIVAVCQTAAGDPMTTPDGLTYAFIGCTLVAIQIFGLQLVSLCRKDLASIEATTAAGSDRGDVLQTTYQ
jgi:hypothetical protein